MRYESPDLLRLAYEVRRFLDKGNLNQRILGSAKLYLEMPDVGAMHGLLSDIMQALDPEMRFQPCVPHYVDEETSAIDVGGISIVVTCKQRFMTSEGKSVGYHSVQFVEVKLPKK